MTTELSSATDDAQLAAEGRLADRFMERLVDRIGGLPASRQHLANRSSGKA
jgi:hypothetical protein